MYFQIVLLVVILVCVLLLACELHVYRRMVSQRNNTMNGFKCKYMTHNLDLWLRNFRYLPMFDCANTAWVRVNPGQNILLDALSSHARMFLHNEMNVSYRNLCLRSFDIFSVKENRVRLKLTSPSSVCIVNTSQDDVDLKVLVEYRHLKLREYVQIQVLFPLLLYAVNTIGCIDISILTSSRCAQVYVLEYFDVLSL